MIGLRREALDRNDVLARDFANGDDARSGGLTVNFDGARSATAVSAAEFRPVERERIAQIP